MTDVTIPKDHSSLSDKEAKARDKIQNAILMQDIETLKEEMAKESFDPNGMVNGEPYLAIAAGPDERFSGEGQYGDDRPEIVQMLIDAGADVDTMVDVSTTIEKTEIEENGKKKEVSEVVVTDRESVLSYATRYGRLETVKTLLKNGADADIASDTYGSLFHAVANYTSPNPTQYGEIAKELIKRRKTKLKEAVDKFGKNALDVALETKAHIETRLTKLDDDRSMYTEYNFSLAQDALFEALESNTAIIDLYTKAGLTATKKVELSNAGNGEQADLNKSEEPPKKKGKIGFTA